MDLLFFLFLCSIVAAQEGVVKTTFGSIIGNVLSNSIEYLGIPYAAPPLNELRWMPPVDWSSNYTNGKYAATQYSDACAQIGKEGEAGYSEDCLYLNIFTPRGTFLPGSLPVLFFIHGGALTTGESSLAVYNGSELAANNKVIVVTTNYRLGVFGFLAVSDAAAAKNTTGNYGFLDQRSALRWTHKEMENFGGDLKRFLLFGESAGGLSTCVQLTMPNSFPYYTRAILESPGRQCTSLPLQQALSGNTSSTYLQLLTNCTSLDCVRALSTDTILYAVEPIGTDWLPVVDGVELHGSPGSLLLSGNFSQVPILTGTNTNEGTLFVYPDGYMNEQDYIDYVEGLFPDATQAEIDSVLQLYPPVRIGDNRPQASQVLGDYLFVCWNRRLVWSTSLTVPTYLYHFNHTVGCSYYPKSWGVYHGSELVFVYDSFGCSPVTDQERDLSIKMGTFWSNFARTGNPNNSSQTQEDKIRDETAAAATTVLGVAADAEWPMYNIADDLGMLLDVGDLTTEQHRSEKYCDFWDSFPY